MRLCVLQRFLGCKKNASWTTVSLPSPLIMLVVVSQAGQCLHVTFTHLKNFYMKHPHEIVVFELFDGVYHFRDFF